MSRYVRNEIAMLALAMTAGAVVFAQGRPDLAPIAQVPVEERLWTVNISSDRKTPAEEFEQLKKACGSASTRAWRECTNRFVEAGRRRIATLHASADPASPIVGSLFEGLRLAGNQLEFEWTLERAAEPHRRIAWADSPAAFDYGVIVAGVQRRGGWVRLLSSAPFDGWLAISPEGSSTPQSIAVDVMPLEGQVVEMSGESYRILGIAAGTVEYRREIPSDFACEQSVTDPVPRPPTIRAPIPELFSRDGRARFSVKYSKGC
jgi:hypothetical protein